MQHVPYKGAAPALTDLISSQIQVVFTSLPSIAQHIRSGTVKGLDATGSKRAVAFKDISTISESGFPDFVINPWFGLFASKGIPANVAKQIHAYVKKILEDKYVLYEFSALGAEPFVKNTARISSHPKCRHQNLGCSRQEFGRYCRLT